MAEENTNVQDNGTGEAKTDAQNEKDTGTAGKIVDKAGDGGKRPAGNDSGGDASADAGADKGGDGKPDAAKPDAKTDTDAAPKSAVPEKYDLKLSEGSLLDSRTVDKVAAIARERGLSNEDAQAQLAEIEGTAMKERNAQVDEWNAALKSDKDLGGANYVGTQEAIQRYGTFLKEKYPDVHSMLEKTGYASNPAIAKYLRDRGKRMAEDSHQPGNAGVKPKEKPPIEERLYGKTTPKAA